MLGNQLRQEYHLQFHLHVENRYLIHDQLCRYVFPVMAGHVSHLLNLCLITTLREWAREVWGAMKEGRGRQQHGHYSCRQTTRKMWKPWLIVHVFRNCKQIWGLWEMMDRRMMHRCGVDGRTGERCCDQVRYERCIDRYWSKSASILAIIWGMHPPTQEYWRSGAVSR